MLHHITAKLQEITNITLLRTPTLISMAGASISAPAAIDKEYIFYTISA